MDRSPKHALITMAAVISIFALQVGLGWYLFPVLNKPRPLGRFDSANEGFFVFLVLTWIAYWIVFYKTRSIRFSDEWRFLGSLGLGLVAAFAGSWAYMVIGLNLYGS
jgi:hypothetical protein